MKSRTTIRDLSKALDISISSVSKALSDSHEISDATKKRVRDYAELYNYRPNKMAASFRRGNTKTVGVIIPNITSPFFTMTLLGIEEHLEKEGYQIITSFSQESMKKESDYVEYMSGGYVDGLILCLSEETHVTNQLGHLSMIIEDGLPLVLFDRIDDSIVCDKVVTNDLDISSSAVNVLVKKHECKNIAMVSSIDHLPHGKLRYDGYKISLNKNELFIESSHYISSTNEKTLNKKIKKLLLNKSIDGIFGADEEATRLVIQIANSLGKDVGSDLSVIGFCNESEKKQTPGLILVDQHAKMIGEKTAKLLLNRINQSRKRKFRTAVVKASLVKN